MIATIGVKSKLFELDVAVGWLLGLERFGVVGNRCKVELDVGSVDAAARRPASHLQARDGRELGPGGRGRDRLEPRRRAPLTARQLQDDRRAPARLHVPPNRYPPALRVHRHGIRQRDRRAAFGRGKILLAHLPISDAVPHDDPAIQGRRARRSCLRAARR